MNIKKCILLLTSLLLPLLLLASCGNGLDAADLSSYPAGDMSGYSGLSSYEKELRFKEVTTSDVFEMMDAKKSFVLFASFAGCPWCNAMIAYLNDVAIEKNIDIAYLNTRKDPSWESNTDIDRYDEFAERFNEYLPLDEDEKPHLYVPDFFVIKDGKVAFEHQGLVPSVEQPQDEMSEEEINELKGIFIKGIDLIK